MITISIADLTMWEVCDLPSRVAAIRAHLARGIADDEQIPLTTWAEITPQFDDLIWALESTPAGRAILAGFACDCAERVLPIWLAVYPDDDRPAAAIRVGRDPDATPAAEAAAWEAGWDAARDAAGNAAVAAARAAAAAAAGGAAGGSAGNAAWDAAWDAAVDAAETAAWEAGWDAGWGAAQKASSNAARAAAAAAAGAAAGAAARAAAEDWRRARLLELVGGDNVDTDMRTIVAAQPVDLGATRTVVERGVEYSYRRAAGATSATISASMASDCGGTGPHLTTTTTHLDDFWRTMEPAGFCRCIRAGFDQLTYALTMAAS